MSQPRDADVNTSPATRIKADGERPDGPISRSEWGLPTESWTLFLVGAACIALSIFTFEEHARIGNAAYPYWMLFTLNGAIAIIGGSIIALALGNSSNVESTGVAAQDERSFEAPYEKPLTLEAASKPVIDEPESALPEPTVSPTRLPTTWETGFPDFGGLSRARTEPVSPVPGFKPSVVGEVMRRISGPLPDRIPHWIPPASTEPEVESQEQAPLATSPDSDVAPRLAPASSGTRVNPSEGVLTDPSEKVSHSGESSPEPRFPDREDPSSSLPAPIEYTPFGTALTESVREEPSADRPLSAPPVTSPNNAEPTAALQAISSERSLSLLYRSARMSRAREALPPVRGEEVLAIPPSIDPMVTELRRSEGSLSKISVPPARSSSPVTSSRDQTSTELSPAREIAEDSLAKASQCNPAAQPLDEPEASARPPATSPSDAQVRPPSGAISGRAPLPPTGVPPLAPELAPLPSGLTPAPAVLRRELLTSPTPAHSSQTVGTDGGWRGGITLFIEPKADRAWDEFLAATERGRRGLCITREFPDRLRRKVGSRDVTIVWLSNTQGSNSIRPNDFGELQALFRRALRESQVSAILLEGLEFMLTINEIGPTVKLLYLLHSQAVQWNAEVFLPLNPGLVRPGEVAQLRLDFPESKAAQ